jgi:hypothetical protein
MTLIRSVKTESVDHESALRLIHSGRFLAGHPTWPAWALYGLGSMNRNLPAYVVLADPGGLPVDGVRNWTSGWLPAAYQGTPFRPGAAPVVNLATPAGVTPGARTRQLAYLDRPTGSTSPSTPATRSWKRASPTTKSPHGCRPLFRKRWISPKSRRASSSYTG